MTRVPRKYTVSLYIAPGELGKGGICFQRGPFSTEDEAVDHALDVLRNYVDPPDRAMVKRPGEHPLWLRVDGDEVVRWRKSDDERLEVWGYAS